MIHNEIMDFFNQQVLKQENISLIIKANIDLKVWNLLTERISKVLKTKIDINHLGKNFQIIIQNLYSCLLNDLKNNFEFFRNVYTMTLNFETKEFSIFASNILNFMGDLKKLKLILNKQFLEFKQFLSFEGDVKKDANDALRFFHYALNNYPYNTRIYSNIACKITNLLNII